MSEKKAVAKTTDKKAVAKKTEGKKKFNIVKTFKDMWAEIKKVTWPSKKELVRQSTVVIVFVLLLTVIVGLMDWGLSALLKLIISRRCAWGTAKIHTEGPDLGCKKRCLKKKSLTGMWFTPIPVMRTR